jgi:hypothetical protein
LLAGIVVWFLIRPGKCSCSGEKKRLGVVGLKKRRKRETERERLGSKYGGFKWGASSSSGRRRKRRSCCCCGVVCSRTISTAWSFESPERDFVESEIRNDDQ